jgi:hypothetical protein
MQPSLPIYTVYRNPSDYPDKFVVRRWESLPVPKPDATPLAVCDSLEQARAAVPEGLTLLDRAQADDPVIVGVWF